MTWKTLRSDDYHSLEQNRVGTDLYEYYIFFYDGLAAETPYKELYLGEDAEDADQEYHRLVRENRLNLRLE